VFSEQARDIYRADLVLIRPDQVVAWRSTRAELAETIIAHVLGSQVANESQRAIA